jgi:inorganic pyrophosphatase
MRRRFVALWVFFLSACAASPAQDPLPPAPAGLAERVATYLESSRQHPQHVWRDTPPLNADGTVNGYIEIPRGESTKWEFDIPLNRREVDRMVPSELGGYPINYGFMPQTVSYDGDPADVLVLGPPLEGGTLVKGRIVALMAMTDTGDLDSKVIISPLDANGSPTHELTEDDRRRMTRFFDTYKNHDGKATKVTGWGDPAAARAFLEKTAGFFAAAKR